MRDFKDWEEQWSGKDYPVYDCGEFWFSVLLSLTSPSFISVTLISRVAKAINRRRLKIVAGGWQIIHSSSGPRESQQRLKNWGAAFSLTQGKMTESDPDF